MYLKFSLKTMTNRHDIMFDKIAATYDILNRILSFGQDLRWRLSLAKKLPKNNIKVLDMGTGTADQLISNHKFCKKIKYSVGLDSSSTMIMKCKEKIKARKLNNVDFVEGSALKIPFRNKSFDAITFTFSIRNFLDFEMALLEAYRILKANGRVIILEFSIPKNNFIRNIYLLYLRIFVPVIGSIISGNKDAYSYLNKSIESFPDESAFCGIMQDAGFRHIKTENLSFGIATIYEGEK